MQINLCWIAGSFRQIQLWKMNTVIVQPILKRIIFCSNRSITVIAAWHLVSSCHLHKVNCIRVAKTQRVQIHAQFQLIETFDTSQLMMMLSSTVTVNTHSVDAGYLPDNRCDPEVSNISWAMVKPCGIRLVAILILLKSKSVHVNEKLQVTYASAWQYEIYNERR